MVKKYMFTSVKDRNTHVRRSEPSHSWGYKNSANNL
ncbi:hypothetical protein MCERE19_01606 [Spirosomataceae bacterium]